MTNWKSTLAFFIFVFAYVYVIYADRSVGIVDVAGNIALISSLFMMMRSEITSNMIFKLIDNIKIGK